MDEEKIQNQISELVGTSPAAIKQDASKPIEAPEQKVGYSTLRTGLPEEMQEAPAQQYATTPEQGIEFGKNTDEMITGGTAIPGFKYDTRFKTAADGGDPLYYEPNFQPVVPYPVGNVESDTLNQNKLDWNIAKNFYGARDEDYLGYYLLPENGSQSFWDFIMGGLGTFTSTALPKAGQGAVNLTTSAWKLPFLGAAAYHSGDYETIGSDPKLKSVLQGAGLRNENWAPLIDRIRTVAPNSDAGMLFNEIMKNSPQTAVNMLNQIQDWVDGAVAPLEKSAFEMWDADPTDTSFTANLGRGISSGVGSAGLALITQNPTLAFTLLNFASAGTMRRNALDYGVSPAWAEAYSIGGSTAMTLLDLFGFENMVGASSFIKKGSVEYLKGLGKKGLLDKILEQTGVALKRGGLEASTEMLQEGIENAYNPEVLENPFEHELIAAISAFAVTAGMLPVSIRHANAAERETLAGYAGLKDLYKEIVKSGYAIVDGMIEKGTANPSQRDAIFNDMLANAPDTIIKTMREGYKGQFDKVAPENRKRFFEILQDIKKNYQGQVFSPATIQKLDKETEAGLANIRSGISDSEVEMIKGLVRGAYVNAAIVNRNNPNYQGFQVPTFVVTKNKNGYSYYDSNKNEIGIHESRSNTEYTNNSPQYAGRLQDSFVPSSRQSDKMASLIHEMSHWMDHVVGEQGFGDFLEHYYNSIAAAFGNDTARRLYNGREGKGKARPSEYFAQTMARMGKRSAEAFGLGKSQANRFLSYANIAMNQLANLEGKAGEKLTQSIADFQTALQQVTKANMDKLSDLIEVYGQDNIKQALENFNRDSEGYGDFAEYLANKDMLQELFDVMDSFADAAGIDKINDLFQGDQKAMDNFVTMGDKMFREGYDKAVDEVRQRRVEAKKTAPKPVEAKTDLDLVRTAIGIVDTTTDSSQVHEDGVDYEIGGPTAALPITQQLGQAQQMMERKASPQEIFKETGWFYDNKDKKWKFEIPSGEASVQVTYTQLPNGKREYRTETGPITDFYINNKLYQAYPMLEKIWVRAVPGSEKNVAGLTKIDDDGNIEIQVRYDIKNPDQSFTQEIVHEVQHAIQSIEGFAVGGAPEGTSTEAYNAYRRLAGEIEARNVQKRYTTNKLLPGLGNTSDVVPTATQDIADVDAIVKFEDTEIAKHIPSPNVDYEEGSVQYETQDWAKAALAKDSVKQSFEAGKQEKKQIAADTKIDGRDLTDDIDMANQGLMQRLKDPMNKLVKWASSSPWGWGLDRILVTLVGRGAAEKLDVQGKYAAKQNIRSQYWDEFMARLKPLFGDPKTNTEFMYKYKTMVNNLGFVRMTGLEMTDPVNPAITFTRDITGWEAMYVYLMKEQGFGDRVQRSTTTKIDDIIATLSDDEKAFALHMSDQLMSMYEKSFGKSKYAHYFPILDAEHELFDELSIDSLMSRQDTDDAIAITDAGRIFSQYISRWASHESNYFQTMKRVRDIFRYTGVDKNEMGPMYTFDLEQDEVRKRASAQVAAAVRQAIGDDGYRNLMNLVESELQDGQEQMFDASRNKTLTQMGSNIIKSILSNKMVSFPKNVANMFMFWGGAKDQGRYWNSFAEGIGNYKDTFKYMMEHSPEIKQRWGAAGGINEYLDQRTLGGSTAPVMKGISKVFAKMDWTGDKTQNMAKFSAVMEMLGDAGLKVFMQSGDMIANVYGGYGLVKDYMAQGMSEADAFRKLDRYIIEHQSSSNLTMKPLVQKLQNKSLLGQVFAFTSEGVAKWASILGTFDEVKMGTATKSEAMANVVSIAISMALYSLIAAGAWDLLDDDEKVQEETVKALGDTLLDQVFGGLVAGNAFITPVVSYLVGDSRVSGMSVPIYNFALDGIAALKKGDYDRVLTKAMSALGVPVGADNAWTTLLGISMANDPNPDVRYAARLMLAGYTPSRSAKRAGIKKETLEKNSEE